MAETIHKWFHAGVTRHGESAKICTQQMTETVAYNLY